MLVYRNQQFGAYTVQTGMYSLRMAVAGGQLSCSILPKMDEEQQKRFTPSELLLYKHTVECR
jgi:hypothetical protein